MGKTVAPPTRSEWTDSHLRAEILSGRLGPGERIPVERLAEAWGVSPTPIRESVRRLAGEGLVDLAPQRGARVATVDADVAAEIYAVRLLLEPVALRESVGRGSDPDFERSVTESFVALTKARGAADQHDRHRAFHLALMARCTNRTLLAEIASLMDRSRLYQFVAKPQNRGAAHADDHRLLMEFAVSGRVDDTIRVHTDHLTNTLRAVEVLRIANQSAE
ncbi:MAG: hypothetical protein B7C54_03280 [Acidimicrobiales bacterium mtb01]|nr:GntR family transcriptional regulator [Actinomycetota bacterium]TEX47315.1 MAG: hypothetical protein B7C54_03280 [Acidimicrobiales bacterium mtb01]